MRNEDLHKKVHFVVKQFLCNAPISEIDWKAFTNLNLQVQDEIIKKTTSSQQVLNYPIAINYQKAFLKHLISHLENHNLGILDSLYEEYGRLVALPSNDANFKHYSIEDSDTLATNIVLKEDIHLISNGTTGLRTWQASLALSEWILGNASHFSNRVILELGSGIGLTGLVLLQYCAPKTVYVTDCHSSVLEALCDNISINIGKSVPRNCYSVESLCLLKESVNSSTISVLNLPWEKVSHDLCQRLGNIDTIVAADVVYDKSIFQVLISAVNCLFENCNVEEFILSCTERNSETLSEFLSHLGKQFQVCIVETPTQKHFLWGSEAPIKIFRITQNSK